MGRSLRSYLLLPRPGDCGKAWLFLATLVLGMAASGSVSSPRLVRALIVWAALEFLVYQARYQWNDIRGFHADQAHPDAAQRGRLPGPVDRARPHIAASAAIAAARLAGAGLIAILLPA